MGSYCIVEGSNGSSSGIRGFKIGADDNINVG
jgi:hypothetical protein